MNRRSLLTALGIVPAMPRLARAQAYPTRPIRLIVTFAAGGPADLFARALSGEMSATLRQSLVLDNRPGTAGVTGIDAVARSEPDGYTLGLVSAAALTTVPFMIRTMPFDWEKDLTPFTLVARVPEVLAVNARLNLNTAADLVAYARAHPRKVNFGSTGIGTVTQLASELFKSEAGIDITHVPYRGGAPAVNDLVAGHIEMATLDLPVLLPQIQAGTLKALAVTTATRAKALPDVPTTAEIGYPKVLAENWYGLVGPARLRDEVADMIRAAAVAALKSPELVRQFGSQEATPWPTTPAEFKAVVMADRMKWEPLIAATGVKLE